MMRKKKAADAFFDTLCAAHYENVLRYLFRNLGGEEATRDTAQEVFLAAWEKRGQLMSHPNPGGWLFLTAKNLAGKARREAFRRMSEEPLDEAGEPADNASLVEVALDRQIDESAYVEQVLARLTPDKRRLYTLHYLEGISMRELAARQGVDEAALRMRFVRLRREIRGIAAEVAEKNFSL